MLAPPLTHLKGQAGNSCFRSSAHPSEKAFDIKTVCKEQKQRKQEAQLACSKVRRYTQDCLQHTTSLVPVQYLHGGIKLIRVWLCSSLSMWPFIISTTSSCGVIKLWESLSSSLTLTRKNQAFDISFCLKVLQQQITQRQSWCCGRFAVGVRMSLLSFSSLPSRWSGATKIVVQRSGGGGGGSGRGYMAEWMLAKDEKDKEILFFWTRGFSAWLPHCWGDELSG